ncbi:MAG TPA: hypothetical protein PKZ97_18100, partial [Azospirillaceae bacterium]|nr:hypothetical protein [Azospirillaceae bacterium]
LSKQFRAAAEAAGVAATSQGLVSKATSEAEGHIATLNRVAALAPAEMAKLGTSAGDVARIMANLRESIDPVAAAIREMSAAAAAARVGDGAEGKALAALQKINAEREKLGKAPLSTVSPEYLDLLTKAKELETARVEGAMKSGKIVDLEKRIAAARAAGDQAAALRLEREKAVADMVERGVDPTVAATKANQDYAVSMAGLSAAGSQWEKGQNAAILAAKRLAEAQALGAKAVREAEIVNRAAAQAEAERVALDSARGQAILAKVRAEEKWKQAASESAALRAANDNLNDLRAEIALYGQSAAVRERAVRSIQIQRQAVEQFGIASSDAARQWIALQEEIADAQAVQRFQQEVDRVSEDIAGDLATAMFEGFAGSETDILDWFKGLLKRMAIEIVKQQFILPITTQVVSAVPDLFGISTPVTGAQAAAAAAGQGGGLGSMGDLLSLGSKFAPSSWTNGITSAIDTWGYNALGIGTMATTTSSMMTAGAGGLAANLGVMPMAGGVSNAAAVGSTSATAGSLTGGLSAYLGSAGIGPAWLQARRARAVLPSSGA